MAFVAIPICALAQNKNLDSSNKQTFNFYSHQISIGYGFSSAPSLIGNYEGNVESGHLYSDGSYWGNTNVNYTYRYSDLITFGLGYTYTGMKRDIYSQGSLKGHSEVNINIIMPEFKTDWYKNDFITLYSRAAAGVAIANIKDDYIDDKKNNSNTTVKFAFQASPIGIELGREFAFYVEAGYGYQGILIAGFRYNF